MHGAGQEPTFKSDGELGAVPARSRRTAFELVEGVGQARQRLLERTATAGDDGRLLIRGNSVVEPLRVVVVTRHHAPVGFGAGSRVDERTGRPRVQLTSQAWRRKFGRALAEKLMAEPPAISVFVLEYPRPHELCDHTVDIDFTYDN